MTTESVRIPNTMREWFEACWTPEQYSGSDDYANALELIDHLVVETEPHWGACYRCETHNPLYGVKFPIRWSGGDNEIRFVGEEHLCEPCLNRITTWMVFNHWNLPHRDYTTINIPNLKRFPDTSRGSCESCGGYLLQEGDYNYRDSTISIYLSGHSAPINVHLNCSWLCEVGSTGCQSRYPRRSHDESVRIPNRYYVNGHNQGFFCQECFDRYSNELAGCERCDNYDWEDDIYYSDISGENLCTSCLSESYVSCDHCGDEYRENRNHRCSQSEVSGIYYYSYKPEPIFYGSDKYHLGIELEVEAPDNDRCNPLGDGVDLVRSRLGNRVYLKEDASIEYGFEIVTHPHSLKEFQTNFKWDTLEMLSRDHGFRSWDTTTCGLHVHVSRTAFDESRNKVNRHELKFIKFIYDNQRAVQALAGRESSYAKFNDKGKLVRKLVEGIGDGHFSAVNTEPENTIEIRVFRGSLNPKRVLSAIEFVHAAVEHTRTMKVAPKDRPMGWSRFVAYVSNHEDKYPNLVAMLDQVANVRNPNTRTDEE